MIGSSDHHAATLAKVERSDKWLATARAVCALRGIELHLLEGDAGLEFIVTRGPFTQSSATRPQLIALLRDLGVELSVPPGEGQGEKISGSPS